jgi:hypothetical protein
MPHPYAAWTRKHQPDKRFGIGVIKAISARGVTETMRDLNMNVRLVFDYLKMTKNSLGSH